VNDFLPISRRDLLAFEGPRRAWDKALAGAGCRVQDLSFAEVHDCFTIAELLAYEAMGLARPGHGAERLEDGCVYPGGALPINPSGGLKAKGIRSAPPACRCMCWRRCSWPARPAPCRCRGRIWGRLQHGRRGGGELRQHSGAGEMNLAHILARSARSFPERPALLVGDRCVPMPGWRPVRRVWPATCGRTWGLRRASGWRSS
jgi:hypothetical protein